jgi:hypothetical protein
MIGLERLPTRPMVRRPHPAGNRKSGEDRLEMPSSVARLKPARGSGAPARAKPGADGRRQRGHLRRPHEPRPSGARRTRSRGWSPSGPAQPPAPTGERVPDLVRGRGRGRPAGKRGLSSSFSLAVRHMRPVSGTDSPRRRAAPSGRRRIGRRRPTSKSHPGRRG